MYKIASLHNVVSFLSKLVKKITTILPVFLDPFGFDLFIYFVLTMIDFYSVFYFFLFAI